jgi:amino acid permease
MNKHLQYVDLKSKEVNLNNKLKKITPKNAILDFKFLINTTISVLIFAIIIGFVAIAPIFEDNINNKLILFPMLFLAFVAWTGFLFMKVNKKKKKITQIKNKINLKKKRIKAEINALSEEIDFENFEIELTDFLCFIGTRSHRRNVFENMVDTYLNIQNLDINALPLITKMKRSGWLIPNVESKLVNS